MEVKNYLIPPPGNSQEFVDLLRSLELIDENVRIVPCTENVYTWAKSRGIDKLPIILAMTFNNGEYDSEMVVYGDKLMARIKSEIRKRKPPSALKPSSKRHPIAVSTPMAKNVVEENDRVAESNQPIPQEEIDTNLDADPFDNDRLKTNSISEQLAEAAKKPRNPQKTLQTHQAITASPIPEYNPETVKKAKQKHQQCSGAEPEANETPAVEETEEVVVTPPRPKQKRKSNITLRQ